MSAQTAPAPRIDQDDLEALQAAVSVLAAKWSVVVLTRLADGSSRFNELLRQIDGVSRRMLSATLRQLERDGLIERHVFARVPARVGYELSPAGQELAAKHHYRPRDEQTRARHAATFAEVRLFTIAEAFGGWKDAQRIHFADGGVFDQIYARAGTR